MKTEIMPSVGQQLYRRGAALLAGRGLRRFAWVNRVNALVRRRLGRREAQVLGHRMILDQNDSLELSWNGIYEPLETRIAQELVVPGGTVVDVGANIGYYTLLFARAAGPKGKVYAFEPESENFSVLEQNIRRNNYTNVKAENLAVSSANSTLRLFVNTENRGDHRIYEAAYERRKSVSIQAVSLDDYFAKGFPKISLLKMDIQGAEGQALSGMTRLLGSAPPANILMEFWPLGLKRAGSSAVAVLETLQKHGYQLSLLEERKDAVRPISQAEILAEFTEERGNQTNLLARL